MKTGIVLFTILIAIVTGSLLTIGYKMAEMKICRESIVTDQYLHSCEWYHKRYNPNYGQQNEPTDHTPVFYRKQHDRC